MKPRILQLGKFDIESTGGIEKVTSSINRLLKIKYSIFTIYLGKYTFRKKNLYSSKINFSLNSFYFSLDYLITAYKLYNKCDYLIGHMPNPLCIILLLKPKRYILFWHSDIIGKNLILNFLYKPIEFILIFYSSEIIYTSDEYRLKSYSRFFNSNYRVIPLSTTSSNIFIKKKVFKKKILSVGRLVSYKNYYFLLSAMVYLQDYHLTIVGSGPEYPSLIKYINANNINNVSIITNISHNQLSQIYTDHDIFCLASNTRAEAFGIVLIEALSFGLPILVGNNKGSGMLSICRNNFNGFIFDYQIDDFLNKINAIYENYESYSNNAVESYNKKYTDQSFIDNMSSAIVLAK